MWPGHTTNAEDSSLFSTLWHETLPNDDLIANLRWTDDGATADAWPHRLR